ncbi:MAG: hypothetical protein KDH48_02340 [Rhodoferax sp.]|nr:hypothetical protein [Rhodoferax sp.]
MLSTLLSRKFAVATALAVAAWGAAGAAHARSDVVVSIGIHLPGVHVQTVPVHVPPRHVYVQPRPVVVHPAPIYVQPRPVYVQPHPVFIRPPAHGHHHGKLRHGWRQAQWERAHAHGHRGPKGHGGHRH